ncbi:septal ring lytic transglycosylase RlpA family protein [Lujinxingia vulgaris]|uniref:Probable endolytic peptidoglycan transglycosylase RlpA n=2 Tax=Lujinxingia vulgaris TaxID=2600176 RepID=A0A5C6XL32_9DELT|nr:septal ring lytic transglycosylase RlpA family protein [Lujinxingia vulgaris]TXD38307.1 septal ring lytic transglycosylase RlpA family protein [Lujinxingia vulgaris]
MISSRRGLKGLMWTRGEALAALRQLLLGGFALWMAACATTPADPHRDLVTHRVAAPDGREHELRGVASWYGDKFHGRQTASGELYDMEGFTAAHKTLPFHTIVRVIEPESRRSVVVRITDRGPFVRGRIIDLSRAAARDLGMLEAGTVDVILQIEQWGDGSYVSNP